MSVPHSEGCPFCEISTAYDPTDDIPLEAKDVAHCILSTPHVLAFLDHQPIERGHVLVTTRGHYEKLSNVPLVESSALGAWLPIISRAVVKVIESDHPQDWNVVQNNGPRAAQVVPHVHFHIIPRTGMVPELKAKSWTIFGRGQRMDLDDEDAVLLIKQIQEGIRRELDAMDGKDLAILKAWSHDSKL